MQTDAQEVNPLHELDRLIQDLQSLQFGDEAGLADILRRAEALMRDACGEDSPALAELRRLRFRPYSLPAAQEYAQGLWQVSRERALALLEQVKKEESNSTQRRKDARTQGIF
jgi:hypothetical protein